MIKPKTAKKQKPLFLHVPIHVYRRSVVLAIGATIDEVAAHGIKNGIDKDKLGDNWKKAYTSMAESRTLAGICGPFGGSNGDILIMLPTKPEKATEYGVLYHEISHAVDKICYSIDPTSMLFDKEGDSEARAYLFEYIITEFNRELWSVPKKKRNKK